MSEVTPITHKTCTNCGFHGEVDIHFSRTLGKRATRLPTKAGDWHSRCKDCRSKIVGRAALEKKLELFPHLYVECSNDECDHIYNKCHEACRRCGTAAPGKGHTSIQEQFNDIANGRD